MDQTEMTALTAEQIQKRRQARRAAERRRVRRNRILAAVFIFAVAVTAVCCNKKESAAEPRAAALPASETKEENESEPEIGKTAEAQKQTYSPKEAVLYSVDRATPFYTIDCEGGVSFDSPDGAIDGLYTGRVSERYGGYFEIDYKDGAVLIGERSAVAVTSADVLPAGAISQFAEGIRGWSACGAACLYMLRSSLGAEGIAGSPQSYGALVGFAEKNGYADQGSLLEDGGGMSCTALERLAEDAYGITLENAYSEEEKPSDILKRLIDGGKQAITLCRHSGGSISSQSGAAHFILVTGYSETGGETVFFYANSYYESYPDHGNPLGHISSEILDSSVSADFDEPNAILYAAD